MEHLLRADRDGCWPWASLYPREIPDHSDLTVNSNVLESVLRCGGVFFFFFFFFFATNFPDGFSLLKVYLEKGHLSALIFSSGWFSYSCCCVF